MTNSKKPKTLKQAGKIFKALGVSAIMLGGAQVAQANSELMRVVHLQATASKLVSNDEMSASLYIEEQQTNPTVLAKNLANAMNAALATAKKYPDIKVSTGAQHTYPVYDKNQKIRAWQGRAQIDLNSQNFEQTGKLIAELQENLKLGNVSFQTSEATREMVENELMVAASKKFQERAQALLGVWGASSYELVELNLNTSGSYQPPMMYARAESMSLKSADIPEQNYAGGESNISVTASGRVQLK